MQGIGAILAGGRSERFGSDKAEARLDGRRLIDWVADALAPQVTQIVFCGRDEPGRHCLADRPESGIGPLGDSLKYKQCAEGYAHVIEHLPGPSGHTRDGFGKYSDSLTWPLEPFIGTLATAPEREVFTSVLGQGPFGGNIDCRDIRAGHTVYLNTYHDGALLYVGDVHGGLPYGEPDDSTLDRGVGPEAP